MALVLIPALKYPPNPPTVGDPDTIGQRSTQFLLLMAASVVVVVGRLVPVEASSPTRGWGGAPRFLAGGGGVRGDGDRPHAGVAGQPRPDQPARQRGRAGAGGVGDRRRPDVLAGMLDTARETGDGWIRDPPPPIEPLDLGTVTDPTDLVGVPAAVSTTQLVADAYTTMIWHFRRWSSPASRSCGRSWPRSSACSPTHQPGPRPRPATRPARPARSPRPDHANPRTLSLTRGRLEIPYKVRGGGRAEVGGPASDPPAVPQPRTLSLTAAGWRFQTKFGGGVGRGPAGVGPVLNFVYWATAGRRFPTKFGGGRRRKRLRDADSVGSALSQAMVRAAALDSGGTRR